MKREEIGHEVQEVLRDLLGKKDLVIRDNLTASEVKGWDSFTHVAIMDAIEKQFKIKFNLSELDKLTNVGDILSTVEKKLNK
jgi:acyl carrier protein